MATFKSFTEIKAWQHANDLNARLFAASQKGLFGSDSDLRSQAVRASNSIPLNIAEGSRKRTATDFRRFLSVAYGSAAEVESCLLQARARRCAREGTLGPLIEDCRLVSRLIAGLMKYLATVEVKMLPHSTFPSPRRASANTRSSLPRAGSTQFPISPETSESPATPETIETSVTTATPETTETTATPETTETTETSETPETTETPETPETTETSETPETP